MTGEPGEGSERKREYDRRWRREHDEELREYRRRYREEHAERIAESHRTWRAENLERSRELNRLSGRRQAKRRRQRLTRNARARANYRKIREASVERARRFRHEHPDMVREYQRRYKERHPERARHNAAESAKRYRDRHAEEIRERQRLAAAQRRRANPDEYKESYARNLEAERARGREAARRRARLQALGLPPRRIHRVYASERRAADASADEFFQRRRTVDERAAIATEARDADALEIPAIVKRRRRQLLREPSTATVEERNRRANLGGDHRPRRSEGPVETRAEREAEIAREHRAAAIRRIKVSHETSRQRILNSRPQIYEFHRRRHEARVREEVRMDSVARQLLGLTPYEPRQETAARIDAEVSTILRGQLQRLRERTLDKVDRVLERYDRAPQSRADPSREKGFRLG